MRAGKDDHHSLVGDGTDVAAVPNPPVDQLTLIPSPPRLLTLDAGRGLAAMAVLLFHLNDDINLHVGAPTLHDAFLWGHAGVDYFFVLSGFVMVWSQDGKYGERARTLEFVRRRAIRLLPMLWLVLGLLVIMRKAMPGMTNSHLDLSAVFLNFFLIPNPTPLILNPTWTLQREVFFYAIFAIAISGPRLGFSILSAWQAMILLVFLVPTLQHNLSGYYPLFVFDTHNAGFGLGMTAAFAYLRLRGLARWANFLLLAGAVGFGMTAIAESWLDDQNAVTTFEFNPLGDQLGSLLSAGFASLLVLGMVLRERSGQLRHVPRFLLTLGGASYVLYLIHEPVGSLLLRIVSRLGLFTCVPIGMIYLAAAPAAVAVALIIHMYVERPLMKTLRQVARMRRQRAGQSA